MVFIILTLVVTGACCSGFAMSVISSSFSVCLLNAELVLFTHFVFRDFGTKSESKEQLDFPKEV